MWRARRKIFFVCTRIGSDCARVAVNRREQAEFTICDLLSITKAQLNLKPLFGKSREP